MVDIEKRCVIFDVKNRTKYDITGPSNKAPKPKVHALIAKITGDKMTIRIPIKIETKTFMTPTMATTSHIDIVSVTVNQPIDIKIQKRSTEIKKLITNLNQPGIFTPPFKEPL